MRWVCGGLARSKHVLRFHQSIAGHPFAFATLMANGHARPCEIQMALGPAHRSLMRWRSQLEERGPGGFYQPQTVRGASVLTAEKSAQCQRLLDDAHGIPATIRQANSAKPSAWAARGRHSSSRYDNRTYPLALTSFGGQNWSINHWTPYPRAV